MACPTLMTWIHLAGLLILQILSFLVLDSTQLKVQFVQTPLDCTVKKQVKQHSQNGTLQMYTIAMASAQSMQTVSLEPVFAIQVTMETIAIKKWLWPTLGIQQIALIC